MPDVQAAVAETLYTNHLSDAKIARQSGPGLPAAAIIIRHGVKKGGGGEGRRGGQMSGEAPGGPEAGS